MPAIVSAWLVGEGIIFWRSWKANQRFPIPGQLLAASFIFAALAVIAESEKARFFATAMAWGFDVAALMNVLPQVATGGTNTGPNPLAATGTQPVGSTTEATGFGVNTANNTTLANRVGTGRSKSPT